MNNIRVDKIYILICAIYIVVVDCTSVNSALKIYGESLYLLFIFIVYIYCFTCLVDVFWWFTGYLICGSLRC